MENAWSSAQHFVNFGGIIPIEWVVVIVSVYALVVLGRLSTHSFGPLSALLFIVWYVAFIKWVIGGEFDGSAPPTIMFYPKAFVAMLVFIFIMNLRRAELEAEQMRRNRRSTESMAAALRQVTLQTPDAPSQRNTPRFSLYLRPFDSTNELPVQFDHGRHTLVGERIDLENILRQSLARNSLFVAIGRPDDDIIGADRIEGRADWRMTVADLISRAERIFVLPSHHDGTLWEIAWLVKNRRLANCIWIMPECVFRKGTQLVVTSLSINWFQSDDDQAALEKAKMEWSQATNAVKAYGVHLPAYQEQGLLFKLNDAGQVVASGPLNLRNTLRRVSKVRRLIKRLQG